jgi:thiamine biosynthesis protein ThiS
MTVNGETIALGNACTLGEFLKAQGYRRDRIAVELNSEIITKEQYELRPLSDFDRLEIVQFMGGG